MADSERRQGTTVKNGTITGFADGVVLAQQHPQSAYCNLTSSDNSGNGINVGVRSLVKGCAIEDNGENGIIIGEFGQVQGCTITGHAGVGFGIFGGRPPVGQGQHRRGQ